MSYPNISMNYVLNYLYAKNWSEPFKTARCFADSLYSFARRNTHIKRYANYMDFVLLFLNALTGDIPVSAECQNAMNHYFADGQGNIFLGKVNVTLEYVSAIRAGTKKLTAEYNAALERTAETRRILDNSCPIIFDNGENFAAADYIKYVETYEPNSSTSLFLSSMYCIGIVQGIRAERARRNGKNIPNNARTTAAAYTGRKHERRYPHTEKAD